MFMLNYHHLRYFRAIAREGTLTGAARRLNLSQSSLSIQLRQLEESFGQTLFSRESKSLVLTEAGRIALDYAETIFRTGDELLDLMQHRGGAQRSVLRLGAVSTLSRNFQTVLLRPLFGRDDVELVLRSGNLRDLLGMLQSHQLDVVLSNLPAKRDAETPWHSHLLDEQPVSLVGRKLPGRRRAFRFPDDLREEPLLLPGHDSNLRAAFDGLMEALGIRPVLAAEVDDMAMLRLLATEGAGLALVPPVVVKQELEKGALEERHRFPEIRETFYAITLNRRFPNPILRELFEPYQRRRN
ncbi:MAG: LysR family transcriptional regulator [Verrucomicrobiae bacterium]|nr:LysR family transcriptional regulator [Verrucomicrobiae bacterium]